MQQSPATASLFFGVAEDYCMLSTLLCSAFLYVQFLARCHPYFIFNDFYTCTTMSDAELDNIIHEIKRESPTCGNKQMLYSCGFRVQQIRICVRESIWRVGPEGTIMRRLSAVHRRQYQVAAPLSLWYIDEAIN